MIRIALVSLVLAACGNDGGTHVDAPGANLTLSGEIVDWDSTDALFCGVFGAGLTVHGNTALTDSTNPNGRITLMVPDAASVQIDVTAPTMMSQCETGIGLYQLPATIITSSAVINSGKTVSYRMIGMDRIAPFFTGLGVTYDSTKALVFVHVEGTQKAVTSSAAHDAAIAWSGSAWAAGSTGIDVVFPNTPPGTTMVDAGGALGAGSVPTTAGSFTYVTLVTN
jgi:hypothetical protein